MSVKVWVTLTGITLWLMNFDLRCKFAPQPTIDLITLRHTKLLSSVISVILSCPISSSWYGPADPDSRLLFLSGDSIVSTGLKGPDTDSNTCFGAIQRRSWLPLRPGQTIPRCNCVCLCCRQRAAWLYFVPCLKVIMSRCPVSMKDNSVALSLLVKHPSFLPPLQLFT